MSKNEVTRFKNSYINFLKKHEKSDLCKWLENATDFEKPDGYYFDRNNKFLVIFEHFDIDCSEQMKKKTKSLGSTLRKNYNDTNQEVQNEIQSSGDLYESTKVIEQGYYTQSGNNKTFHIGENGDKYRDNFVKNFKESFDSHSKKIEEYKTHVIQELKIQPTKIQICFLVEDKTLLGTYYLTKKKSYGDPVILTDTLQFQEIINRSSVDHLIFGRQQDKIACIGHKGDSKSKKIDLNEREFFVFPAIPLFTASKKSSIE